MKNLPENDMWEKVGERLEAYTEIPADDMWDKIAGGAIPSGRSSTIAVWVDRFTVLSLLICISFMAGYFVGKTTRPEATLSMAQRRQLPEKALVLGERDETSVNSSVDQDEDGVPAARDTNASSQDAGSTIPHHRSSNGENVFAQNKHLDSRSMQVDRHRTGDFALNTTDAEKVATVVGAVPTEDNQVPGNVTLDSVGAVEQDVRVDSAAHGKPGDNKVSEKKKSSKHTQLYFTVSPALSFQKITPGHGDEINVQGLRSPGVLSRERFGLALEIGLQRQLSKRLEAYCGVSYYHQRQQLTYEYDSPDEVDITSAAGNQYTIKPQRITRSFNYNMLNAGVAAGLLYHIKGVKLMHKLGAGLQYQKGFLRSASEGTYDNAGSSYLNYQLSYRIEYTFTRRLNIFIQPAFTHAFYSKEKLSEPFTVKPYRASMGFGAIYRF